jgi:hypothetical protein
MHRPVRRAYFFDILTCVAHLMAGKEHSIEKRRTVLLNEQMISEFSLSLRTILLHQHFYPSLIELTKAVAIAIQTEYLEYFQDDADIFIEAYPKPDNLSIEDVEQPINEFVKKARLSMAVRFEQGRFAICSKGERILRWCLSELLAWLNDPYKVYACQICGGLIPPAKRSPKYCSFNCRQWNSRIRRGVTKQ